MFESMALIKYIRSEFWIFGFRYGDDFVLFGKKNKVQLLFGEEQFIVLLFLKVKTKIYKMKKLFDKTKNKILLVINSNKHHAEIMK